MCCGERKGTRYYLIVNHPGVKTGSSKVRELCDKILKQFRHLILFQDVSNDFKTKKHKTGCLFKK